MGFGKPFRTGVRKKSKESWFIGSVAKYCFKNIVNLRLTVPLTVEITMLLSTAAADFNCLFFCRVDGM